MVGLTEGSKAVPRPEEPSVTKMPQPTLRTVPLNGRSSFPISEIIAVAPVEMWPELRFLEVRGDPVRITVYNRHNLLSSRRIGALADIQVRYLAVDRGIELRVTKFQFGR